MLVQLEMCPVEKDFVGYAGIALCQKCGASVGALDNQELEHLLKNNWRDVLCFQCEEFPFQPYFPIGGCNKLKLLRLYNVQQESELPLSSCAFWSNSFNTFIMQKSKNFGWCLWEQVESTYGLIKVHMSHKEADGYRTSLAMLPREGK